MLLSLFLFLLELLHLLLCIIFLLLLLLMLLYRHYCDLVFFVNRRTLPIALYVRTMVMMLLQPSSTVFRKNMYYLVHMYVVRSDKVRIFLPPLPVPQLHLTPAQYCCRSKEYTKHVLGNIMWSAKQGGWRPCDYCCNIYEVICILFNRRCEIMCCL